MRPLTQEQECYFNIYNISDTNIIQMLFFNVGKFLSETPASVELQYTTRPNTHAGYLIIPEFQRKRHFVPTATNVIYTQDVHGPASRLKLREILHHTVLSTMTEESQHNVLRKVTDFISDCQLHTFEHTDVVLCLQCPRWPTEASDFATRRRSASSNWPSTKLIGEIVDAGCHIVQVVV